MNGLGDVIRLRREDLSLTQTKAAEAAGMQQSTWSEYECGRKVPTLPVLERIARVLKVRIGELVGAYHPTEA